MSFCTSFYYFLISLSVSHDFTPPPPKKKNNKMTVWRPKIWGKSKNFAKIITNQQILIYFKILSKSLVLMLGVSDTVFNFYGCTTVFQEIKIFIKKKQKKMYKKHCANSFYCQKLGIVFSIFWIFEAVKKKSLIFNSLIGNRKNIFPIG